VINCATEIVLAQGGNNVFAASSTVAEILHSSEIALEVAGGTSIYAQTSTLFEFILGSTTTMLTITSAGVTVPGQLIVDGAITGALTGPVTLPTRGITAEAKYTLVASASNPVATAVNGLWTVTDNNGGGCIFWVSGSTITLLSGGASYYYKYTGTPTSGEIGIEVSSGEIYLVTGSSLPASVTQAWALALST